MTLYTKPEGVPSASLQSTPILEAAACGLPMVVTDVGSVRDYADEPWFVELLAGASSHVITDVHLGFRDEPHYTMALNSTN